MISLIWLNGSGAGGRVGRWVEGWEMGANGISRLVLLCLHGLTYLGIAKIFLKVMN